jgi:hypothetical protein
VAAAENKAEPTAQYHRELYDAARDYWPPQFEVDEELDDLYWDTAAVETTDTQAQGRRRKVKPERMTSGEMARAIDLIVSLIALPSVIGVQWVGEGKRGKSTDDKVEIALAEAIEQLNPPTDSPLKRGRWAMTLFGREARLMLPGGMYYSDFPYMRDGESLDDWTKRHESWRKGGPLPIMWVDLPVQSTFPASFSRMDDEAISWQEATLDDLRSMFSERELGEIGEGARTDKFTLSICANRRWLSYGIIGADGGWSSGAANDRVLRSIEHGMDVLPIRILPGPTSGQKKPGRYWLGPGFHMRKLVKAADRALSLALTASKFDALPNMKMWLQETALLEEGAMNDRADWKEGDVIDLRAGRDGLEREDILPLIQPQFGDKTLALAQYALARCERLSGAQEALEGAFGPSGQPAWSRNHAHEVATAKQSTLIDGVTGADLDAAEMVIRCTLAWGEPISLKPIKRGQAASAIILDPEVLQNYTPVLKSTYKLKLPVNKRADYDLGMSLIERAKASKVPVSVGWVMEEIMGIEQPFEHMQEAYEWQFLMSDEMQAFYTRQLVQDVEADLAGDESMGLADLGALAENGQIPQGAAQQLMQLAAGGAASDMGMGPRPETMGAITAGAPLTRAPGGPRPQEETY